MIHITDIHKTSEKMLQSELGPRYVVRYIKMLSDMAFPKKKNPSKILKTTPSIIEKSRNGGNVTVKPILTVCALKASGLHISLVQIEHWTKISFQTSWNVTNPAHRSTSSNLIFYEQRNFEQMDVMSPSVKLRMNHSAQ